MVTTSVRTEFLQFYTTSFQSHGDYVRTNRRSDSAALGRLVRHDTEQRSIHELLERVEFLLDTPQLIAVLHDLKGQILVFEPRDVVRFAWLASSLG